MVFAYLIGPPRVLTRQQGSELHGAVCDALGVDDLAYRYLSLPSGVDVSAAPGGPPERTQGFQIQFERKQGRGLFRLSLDSQGLDQPIRFLVEHLWPPSREHVYEDMDAAAAAVFEKLGEGWHRVLAETRIRGQAEAQGGTAVSFISGKILRLSDSKLEPLDGPLGFASILLETEPGDPASDDTLAHPKREIKIEVLREDPRSLYVEVMSQWPQLAMHGTDMKPIEMNRIRSFGDPPSTYIKHNMAFVTDVVLPMFISDSSTR